ncbi:hypothetical protein O181_060763 [Austropuccinia psidii MF-1]|uniref:Uncharacterized protein n=1 Tax=Austropuccinia psidii MF-1 TaxID=1389203 RepID=A0A9Q3HXU8_9BASI|nr:hypothetical protein [Austropuccinia psidii MF-1]
MKETGQVSLEIADFRSLISKILSWGERAYIQVYRRGLESRILDQLTYKPAHFDSLQELMDITLDVALVGEHKTPSLPSSVHILSNITSLSSLPSKDEVLKEIKDVGEDFSISSLHLFQGDMDLPPLSFDGSLKEKWDVEEEPEELKTVLKVVHPAYHQYLDLFSKVKAEKLPPHLTCDHHIKLEGLLPPVGVIYLLSN